MRARPPRKERSTSWVFRRVRRALGFDPVSGNESPARGISLVPHALILWPSAILAIHVGLVAVLIPVLAGLLGMLISSRRARASSLLLILLAGLLFVQARDSTLARASFDRANVEHAVTDALVTAGEPRESRVPGSQYFRAEPAGPLRVGSHLVDLESGASLVVVVPDATVTELEDAGGSRWWGQPVRVRGTATREGSTIFLRAAAVFREPPSSEGGSGAAIEEAREGVRERFRKATSFLPPTEAALVRGMVTGDTEGLGREVSEHMALVGLTHLVAVSGANVALVYAFVSTPMLMLGVSRKRRVLAGAGAIALYVWIVGPEPSLVRAATMAVPLLVGRYIGVRSPAIHALALTIVVWSILTPSLVGEFGFVLSAAATAAILTLAVPCAEAIEEISRKRIPHALALVIATPLVAQLACTPVLVLLRPETSIWSVAANVIAEYLVVPATLAGFGGFLLALLHPLAALPLLALSGSGAHALAGLAATAASVPLSRIPLPAGWAGALVCAAVIGLGIAALILRDRSEVRWASALCAVLLVLPSLVNGVRGAGEWDVVLCDVGQGDAVLVREDESVVLIDTGPEPKPLEACLNAAGVEAIDLLILTHPHADHAGGIPALSGKLTPGRVWACPLDPGRTLSHIHAEYPLAGAREAVGRLELHVLWPRSAQEARMLGGSEGGGAESGLNDCSLTVRITSPRFSLIALGDLEPLAQQELARTGVEPAGLVKVAHHGSRRQHRALYEQIDASVALVGVGPNSFGHPHPTTLAMLSRRSYVLRTDLEGTVALTAREDGRFSVRAIG